MKMLTSVLLLFWICSTAGAQTPADTAVSQIRQLLTPGNHPVHYFRAKSSTLTEEQKALLAKVRNALTENTRWVLDMDSVKQWAGTKDEILNDLRKKLNLTEGEWQSLQDLTDVAKKYADYYGDDTLEVIARGNILFFRGTGKVSRLDSVSFDLGRNVAFFRQCAIPFMGIFHIPASDNGFHTPVLTYAYEMNNHYMTDSTDVNTIHMDRFDFGVSYQPLTRKTLVIFMVAAVNMNGGGPVVQPEVLTFIMD